MTEPAYRIPLTRKQLAILGRITVTWAHIKSALDTMLIFIHGIDSGQFRDLFGDKTAGPKIEALEKAASRAGAPGATESISALCSILKPLAGERNHAIHGLWGLKTEVANQQFAPPDLSFTWPSSQAQVPVAYSARRKTEKLYPASKLPDLYKRIAEASHKTDETFITVTGAARPSAHGRMLYFGNFIPEVQEGAARKPPTPPLREP